MTTAAQDMADVKVTHKVLYAGHVIEPGVHLAGIPAEDGEMLEAIGVATLYRPRR